MSIASNLSFIENSAGAITTGTINATSAPIIFSVNSTENARFDSNNYLLIGYTTSQGAYRLQVNGSLYTSGSIIGNITGNVTGTVSTASNVAGGTAGQIHYQSAPGLTGFAGPGSYGQFLMSTGASAPVYQSTLTQVNGNIIIASNTAASSTTTGALQVVNGGVGIGGSLYVGNTATIFSTANASADYTQSHLKLDVPSGTNYSQLAFTYAGVPKMGVGGDTNGYGYIDSSSGYYYFNLRLSLAGNTPVYFLNRGQYFLSFNNATSPSSAGVINIGAQNTIATNAGNGSLVVQGGIAATNNIVVQSAANSVSTNSGALQVAGGAGIGRDLYVGGNITVLGTINASITGVSTTATNIAGGTAGQLVYQSAPGITGFAGPGTSGQLLVSAGAGAPVYTTTSTIQVGYSANILAGTAGQLHYQSAANTTGFVGPGTSGQFLQSAGAASPTYVSTGTMYVQRAVQADSASGTSGSVANALTFNNGGSGSASGSTFNGSSAVTISYNSIGAPLASQLTNGAANGTAYNSIVSLDSRNTLYSPGDRSAGLFADFKANTTDSLADGGTYHGVLTFRPYGFTNADFTGGQAQQIGTTDNNSLWHRMSTSSSTWGTWYKIIDTNNTSTALINSSVNIAGGTTGQLVYQSAANTTGFVGPGTSGQFLQSAGAGAPTYVSTGTMYVQRAVQADSAAGSAGSVANALTISTGLSGSPSTSYNGSSAITLTLNTATLMASAVQVSNSLTAGTGLTGTAFNGSAPQTWTLNTATLMATSVNLTGGAAGSLLYQSAANATTSLAIGTSGYVLTSNGSAPTWVNASGLSVGSTTAALTMNNSGSGAASGTTFNGSTAQTISYNTIGAPSTNGTNASGTWSISISGNLTGISPQLASATESNSVYVQSPSYTTDRPVKLLTFDWYGNTWSMGNIRSGSTPSNGFGVFYGSLNTEVARFITTGLQVTGTGTFTGEVTAYYSDRRLKENVKIIDNALTKVLSLNGITYTPNELAASFGYDRNVKLVGLFADEVEAVLPEATRPAPFDQDENGKSKSGENYKTIQYEKVVPLLIEAIKEQQERIAQLEDLVKQLVNK
jgi:hypothetical protein